MIDKVRLQNYESHKDSVFDFTPGVNAIVGTSEVGKSSALRAIRLAAVNRPAGVKYIRHGTKKTTVTVNNVKRIRTKTVNKYEVDGSTFKALRSDVPGPVISALRLKELNFQSQHSPYFLIGDPPGQVAKSVNSVGQLGLIDKIQSWIKKDIKSKETTIKFTQTEQETRNDKVAKLEWACAADEKLDQIIALQDEAARLQERVEQDTSIIDRVEAAQTKLNSYPPLLDPEVITTLKEKLIANETAYARLSTIVDAVDEITADLHGVPDFEEGAKSMGTLLEELVDLQREEQRLSSLVNAVDNAQFERPPLEKMQADLAAIVIPEEVDTSILEVADTITALQRGLSCLRTDLEEAEDKFKEAMGNTCQLCGGTLL